MTDSTELTPEEVAFLALLDRFVLSDDYLPELDVTMELGDDPNAD